MRTRSRSTAVRVEREVPRRGNHDTECYICRATLAEDASPSFQCSQCTSSSHAACHVGLFATDEHNFQHPPGPRYPTCYLGHRLSDEPFGFKIEDSKWPNQWPQRAWTLRILCVFLLSAAALALFTHVYFNISPTSGMLVWPMAIITIAAGVLKFENFSTIMASRFPGPWIVFLFTSRLGVALVSWVLPFEFLGHLPRTLIGLLLFAFGYSVVDADRASITQMPYLWTGTMASALQVLLPATDTYGVAAEVIIIAIGIVVWASLFLWGLSCSTVLVATIPSRALEIRKTFEMVGQG